MKFLTVLPMVYRLFRSANDTCRRASTAGGEQRAAVWNMDAGAVRNVCHLPWFSDLAIYVCVRRMVSIHTAYSFIVDKPVNVYSQV